MSQYRQSPFANLTPVVKNLLIINIIFYIAEKVLMPRFDMVSIFSAFYFDSPAFRPWQVITYLFMHDPNNFAHIFGNMLALFFFGPILESFMGSKRFFNYYFICGIGALAMQMGVQAFEVHSITGHFVINTHTLQVSPAIAEKLGEIYYGPVLGASGAIFGILLGVALLFPDIEIYLYFIVPIKAKYFVGIYILFELFLGFGQFGGDDVAHFAHLGGALVGFILIKIWGLRGPDNFF